MTISIDGLETSAEYIYPFYQKQPFPGNHTYELELFFNSPRDIAKIVKRHGLDDFDNVNWNIFFMYLMGVWPYFSDEMNARYFVNSVTELTINDTSIKVKGLASDILSDVPNQRKKPENNRVVRWELFSLVTGAVLGLYGMIIFLSSFLIIAHSFKIWLLIILASVGIFFYRFVTDPVFSITFGQNSLKLKYPLRLFYRTIEYQYETMSKVLIIEAAGRMPACLEVHYTKDGRIKKHNTMWHVNPINMRTVYYALLAQGINVEIVNPDLRGVRNSSRDANT